MASKCRFWYTDEMYPRLFLCVSGIMFGTITVLDRWLSDAGFSVIEISLLPLLFSAIILLPFAMRSRREMLQGGSLKFYTLVGFILAALSVVEVAGLALGVHIAIAALLLYTEPVWTIVLGAVILKERITGRKVLALLLAIAGVYLLLMPDADFSIGSPLGLTMSVLSGLFLSLFIICSRQYERAQTAFVATSFGATFSTIVWLLVMWAIGLVLLPGSELLSLHTSFEPTWWMVFLGFALVSDLIPNLFFFNAMRTQEASSAGIILLLEPLSAIVLASFLFEDPLTLSIILGGALVLAANAMLLTQSASLKGSAITQNIKDL